MNKISTLKITRAVLIRRFGDDEFYFLSDIGGAMMQIFCPGCSNKMLAHEYSCPVCGYTDIYSNYIIDPFDDFGGEFDIDDSQFFDENV